MLQARVRARRRDVVAAVRRRRRRARRTPASRVETSQGAVRARVARRRHRRPHGAEDRRDAVRATASPSSSGSPSCRRARRSCRSRLTPDALARYGDLAGRLARRRGRVRRRALSREPAVHASRPVRARDPAGLVVLAAAATPSPIDLLPGIDARRVARRERALDARGSTTLLAERLPKRFAQQWCAAHERRRVPLRELRDERLARARARAARLARAAVGHARLQQGRGHARRRRHARPVVADDGGATRPGPVLHRRGRSTSPAGSAATTSSGRGRRATPPAAPVRTTSSAARPIRLIAPSVCYPAFLVVRLRGRSPPSHR